MLPKFCLDDTFVRHFAPQARALEYFLASGPLQRAHLQGPVLIVGPRA